MSTPTKASLAELFSRWAHDAPDRIAVVGGGDTLTFEELDALANGLAIDLVTRGVGIGDRVAVRGDRTPEFVVAVIAIWKTGAAYLPIDPQDPPARTARALATASTRLVLDATPDPKVGLPVRLCDVRASTTALPPPAADTVAYTIFTSGSTGTPLAVDVRQESLRHLRLSLESFFARAFPDALLTRVAVNAPATFDASVKQLIQLLNGRVLYLVSERGRARAETFCSFLAEHDVDLVDITPSHLRLLLARDASLRGLEGVRLLVGGEAIDAGLVAALKNGRVGGYAGVYGPTECCVDALAATADELPGLGRPLDGVDVWIMSSDGRLLAGGEEGEIVLGGWGVADGYVAAPSVAAQRFIARPDSNDGRAFRTGDRGVANSDGTYSFRGRIDDEIKVGGRRVHLGEVSEVLLRCPEIRAAALVSDGEAEAFALRAFLVPSGNPLDAVAAAKVAVESWLPPYLRPQDYTVVSELPLTAHGKLDTRALGASGATPTRGEDGHSDATELALLRFRDVLGHDVHLDDNFFEAGGDSLSAVRLIRGLEKETAQSLGLLRFLAEPTPRGLARLLSVPERALT